MTCLVGFYGKYIPLQGVEYIVRAAAHPLCADLQFELIGSGQTFGPTQELARKLGVTNVTFVPKLSYAALRDRVAQFDISLGVFGDTKKAQVVIPNKIYDAMMLGKPIVTADTPAVRELLTDGANALLCRSADAEDLAQKIRMLADNLVRREALGRGARARYEACITPERIGSDLLRDLTEKLGEPSLI